MAENGQRIPEKPEKSKKQLFLENAKLLRDAFGIEPLLYGSLGLECVTGADLNADDIDILIPRSFLTDSWEAFRERLEAEGYLLTDEREHTFEKNGIHYSYARIEELEAFAGIPVGEIETVREAGISFKLLSLRQYLDVYRASAKDGYRAQVRNKKDADKIALIEKRLAEESCTPDPEKERAAEPEVYLEKLSAFSRMLRLQGLAVSPKETEDASRLLILLGMADREQVKTALRTVYAKSREEQLTFDRVFDGFFISEEKMRRQAKEQMEREKELQQHRQEAEEELQLNGQPMDLDEKQRETYATMPEEARQRLRNFMDKYRATAERNPKLYGDFIHSVFARAIMEQQMLMENAGLGAEELDPEIGILYRDISDFKDTEIPKAIAIIQTVARQINGELSAKRKKSGHTGKLDFRRTIRKGLETGGSFYRLKYRRKRSQRKHLVLLCDVSGSMVQFSEFALRFIQSLNQVSDNSRVFLFSESMTEADAFKLQNMDLFRSFVRDSGIYGRGTDLGTALEQLCVKQPAVLNSATTMLILSDTKTIDQPRALRALAEAKRLAGRVIFLNPIPESKWKYIKSIQAMASLCPMVSCSTLRELANACRRLAQK